MAAMIAQRASTTGFVGRKTHSRAVVVPRATLLTNVKSFKSVQQQPPKSSPKAGFELGFTRANEVFVGRLAMTGFAASVVGEILSGGQGALAQLGYDFGLPTYQIGLFLAGLISFNLIYSILPSAARDTADSKQITESDVGPIQNPKITIFDVKKFFGVTDWGFTAQNELFAGRMAQLGFAASLIGELVTGLGPLGQFSAGALWQERFHRAALELIAVTTGSSTTTGRAEQRLAAAAATDAAAPALLKIERAAIAAATPIIYQPQELLLLIYEHLKASGLHSAAAAVAKEAGLAGNRSHAASSQQQQQQQQQASSLVGSQSPASGRHLTAADGLPVTGSAFAAAAAAAASPAVLFTGKASSSSSSLEALGKERRRTLSLGPGLLSHLTQQESSPESEEHKQQQQQQQQQHGDGFKQQPPHQQQHQQLSGRSRTPISPTKAIAAAAASQGLMSPPPPITGSKRRAAAAAAAGAAAGVAAAEISSFDSSPSKRQAVRSTAAASPAAAVAGGGPAAQQQFGTSSSSTAIPATPAAAAAAPEVLPLSPVGVVTSPVRIKPLLAGSTAFAVRPPSSFKLPAGSSSSSAGGEAGFKTPAARLSAAAAAATGSSDADYLQALVALQHQQQQQQVELFHVQNPPAMPFSTQTPASKAACGITSQWHSPQAAPPAAAAQGTAAAAIATGQSGHSNSGTPSPGHWAGFGPLETPVPANFAGFRDGVIAAAGYNTNVTVSNTTDVTPSPSGSQHHASTPAAAAAAVDPSKDSSKETGSRISPLLTNLPSRQASRSTGGLQRRLSGGLDLPHKLTPIAEAVTEPKPLPLHVQIAAKDVMSGPPVNSRLGGIVTAFLKQQHRAACLASAQPLSVVPPVSLLKPYALPAALRPMQAPANMVLRRGRQELFGGFGGRGGASANRRFVWSRFRLTQTLRDDGPLLTACTFLRGFDVLVSGTANGEVKLHDAYSGDNIELIDAHSASVNLLQASPWLGGAPGDQLLLSSSRSEVLLWRADGWDTGPLFTWNGLTRGRFNPTASQIVGVAVGSSPRQARLYDTNTGEVLATVDEAAAAAAAGSSSAASTANAAASNAGGDFVRGASSACFSPSGELILWGATLWDPRVPAPLHTFDQLSGAGAGGCFHPGGSEIILNSEVWDLRTRKLLRSVPALDGASVTFNSSGDVLCAWLRRPADDSLAALLQPKRRRHALATSFISMDARSYTEIGNVQLERAVLDLCLDPSDSYLAAVAVDVGGGMDGAVSSSVRLYEVGRQRPAAGEDDESDGAGEESEDEDEENEDMDGGGLHALLGADVQGDIAGNVSDASGAEGDEGEDLDLNEGMTLEEAIADMYEEAIAAGVDPDELDIDISDDEDDFEEGGEEGDLDEDDLLEALGDDSSEYETDEEAAG